MVLAHLFVKQRMALSQFPPTVLAAVISACASEPVLLNSERIEQRFGSYGIDLLASEAGLRRSSLYSIENGAHICRTYAVVRFADQPDARYGEEHSKVLAGNSIGAIFRSHGWDVHKQTLHIGSLQLPAGNESISPLMRINGPRELALHVYQLLLVRDKRVFDYATILETHHPDYLSEADLYDLYEYETPNAVSPAAALDYAALALHESR
ncbi:MAG: hypothetical protein KJN77_07255 [Gammaproteobacteria bacterium]|nr:hypothetical protein [Gammaproteobacteria bacterium]